MGREGGEEGRERREKQGRVWEGEEAREIGKEEERR